jgi:hypothetical protein
MGEKMNFHDKLKEVDVDKDQEIVLRFKDGADVVHAWDGYEEEVMQETDFASTVAELITASGFKNDVIDTLRDESYLEDYPRDHSGFEQFVGDVIKDNFWDMDFIERETERYDYKRGRFTLEAQVRTTIGSVLSTPAFYFSGWSARVPTRIGVVNIEA